MSIKNKLRTINLHIFAETQTTLLTGLSDEMKTYYSDYLIDLVDGKLIHDQFADKKNIPQGSGKTIEFRKYDPLAKALVPLTEGVTPNGNTLHMSVITAEIHQYGDFIVISDILKLAAIDNNVIQATKLLASQANRTLDTVTRDVMAGGTNVYHAPIISGDTVTEINSRHLITANAKFTPDCAFRAKTELSAQNAAPIDDCYVAIIHPYVSYDLMRNKEWIDVHKYADAEKIYKGEIGKIGGCRFVESSEAKIIKGEDLASDARTLKVAAAVATAGATVTFTGGTVGAGALIGRYVLIDGNKYYVTSNTTTSITLADADSHTTAASITVAQDVVIYPGEGGAGGIAVFCTTFIAQNAYATTALEGGGLEHIVKGLGSSGVADALNQRASVGWKATKAAERLVEQYMIRVESGSTYSSTAKAN